MAFFLFYLLEFWRRPVLKQVPQNKTLDRTVPYLDYQNAALRLLGPFVPYRERHTSI